MVMVHRLPPNLATCGNATDALQRMILCDGVDCCHIDVVFDVYREVSIKGSERERRGQTSDSKVIDIRAGRTIQQWKKFLASSENITHFINFVTEIWMEPDNLRKLGNKVICITNGHSETDSM